MSEFSEKKPIALFLLEYPKDSNLLKQYPEATHYTTDMHNSLILYKNENRLVYIRKQDFEL